MKTGKQPWRCPRCGEFTRDYPALSRKDNKTDVCDRCGTDEALEDYKNSNRAIKGLPPIRKVWWIHLVDTNRWEYGE